MTIDQATLRRHLQKVLDAQNIPLVFAPKGLCSGLTIRWLLQMYEGKKDPLGKLKTHASAQASDQKKATRLAYTIEALQRPDKRLLPHSSNPFSYLHLPQNSNYFRINQNEIDRNIKKLKIMQGKTVPDLEIKKIISFPFTAQEWCEILKDELPKHPNEMIYVNGNLHAVGCFYKKTAEEESLYFYDSNDREKTPPIIVNGSIEQAVSILISKIRMGIYRVSQEHDEYLALGFTFCGKATETSDKKNPNIHSSVKFVLPLLNRDPNVAHRTDGKGYSGLHMTSDYGDVELTKLLLEHGANVNLADSGGAPPLLIAVVRDNRAVAELLINAGADVNSVDSQGLTFLSTAAHKGYRAVVELLLNAGADVVDVMSLVVAAENGYPDVIELLLQALTQKLGKEGTKVVVDSKSVDGLSPLRQGVQDGHVKVVELLIKAGADVDKTFLLIAAERGHSDVVALLLKFLTQKLGKEGAKVVVNSTLGGFFVLHRAVQNGHDEVVKLLLDAGADIGLVDSEGETLLWRAIQNGNPAVVARLLQVIIKKFGNEGARNAVNLRSAEGFFPMYQAIINKSANVVQQLINAGAEVDLENSTGVTLLLVAAERSNSDVVELLLQVLRKKLGEKGARAIVNLKSARGLSPLRQGAQNSDAKVVKLLLDAGADVDITSLLVAAESGNPDVVELLINAGAELDSAGLEGETALSVAVQKGHCAVVELLLQVLRKKLGADGVKSVVNLRNKKGHPLLLLAATRDDTGVSELLISAGANVDLRGLDDIAGLWTWEAVRYSHIKMVERLIDAGADVNLTGLDGVTLLLMAADKSHPAVVELLLQALRKKLGEEGARAIVNLKSDRGSTPLCKAVHRDDAKMVGLLLDAGAEVGSVDSDGQTCLLIAAEKSSLDVIKLLVEALIKKFGKDGARDVVNLKSAHGLLPLRQAIQGGRFGVVKLLLDAGADVDLVDPKGVASLWLAIESGNPDLIELLLEVLIQKLGEEGAKVVVNSEVDGDLFPLHQAVQNGHRNVVEPLLKALIKRFGKDGAKAIVNSRNKEGRSPLFLACEKCDGGMVGLLVSAGADIGLKDLECGTALLSALICENVYRNMGVVRLLLTALKDRGKEYMEAVVNSMDEDGFFPLLAASGQGCLELVHCLIQAGAKVDLIGPDHTTCLLLAVKNEHLSVLKLLLTALKKLGSEQMKNIVNLRNEKGVSPLFKACVKGRADMVELLIQAGAIVDQKSRQIATQNGHRRMLELFSPDAQSEKIVDEKASNNTRNSPQEVKQLLFARGAGVNFSEKSSAPSASDNTKEVKKLLLAVGSDVNFKIPKSPSK